MAIHDLFRFAFGVGFCLTASIVLASEPTTLVQPQRSEHWAFQPMTSPDRPELRDVAWPLSDVDCFVLSRLEREELRPAPDADRYTWLRRVNFDLTGLPPTPEQIRGFLEDQSPTAWLRAVDRLLAAPAFGERWSRHWLDLVGYADQIGTSNNVFAEHAWRYRDYVIDAFNADIPFDLFIRQQIAGDLLPYDSVEQRAANLTATGFLVLGDVEIVEADKAKLRVDVIDQQVDKTSKAFLGMTLACARCHDHKFDPITQREYYAVAGMFHSTTAVYKTERGVWSSVLTVELPETDAQRANRIAASQQHASRVATLKLERDQASQRKEELNSLLEEESTEVGSDQTSATKRQQLDELAKRIEELDQQIAHAEFFAPQVPLAYGVQDVEHPSDMSITIRGNPRALGDAVPRGFMKAVFTAGGPKAPSIPVGESGRSQLADWIANPDNSLTSRVAVNRIWQKIFGQGLVRSVDYFGLRGQTPSHPELLDNLASRFVSGGWSQKRLIRQLVLSRVYRMSGAHDRRAAAADPDNRLLWRMNRQRLDAEALRDALLAVSGKLVRSGGGAALPLEFPENIGNLDPKAVNPPSFSLNKYRPEQDFVRTVYLPVIRHAAQPGPAELRNVFDFAQPALCIGQRTVTAVPTQALFLMNSPVLKQRASDLSKQVMKHSSEDTARLEWLWLSAMNRPITADERSDALAFLNRVRDNLRQEDAAGTDDGPDSGAWTELCHAVIASNEFLMRL